MACTFSTCHLPHVECARHQATAEDALLATVASSVLLQVTTTNQNFNMFLRDPSVPKDVRIKGIEDILGEAKFSPLTRNLLGELVIQRQRLVHERSAQEGRQVVVVPLLELDRIPVLVCPPGARGPMPRRSVWNCALAQGV